MYGRNQASLILETVLKISAHAQTGSNMLSTDCGGICLSPKSTASSIIRSGTFRGRNLAMNTTRLTSPSALGTSASYPSFNYSTLSCTDCSDGLRHSRQQSLFLIAYSTHFNSFLTFHSPPNLFSPSLVLNIIYLHIGSVLVRRLSSKCHWYIEYKPSFPFKSLCDLRISMIIARKSELFLVKSVHGATPITSPHRRQYLLASTPTCCPVDARLS